MKILLIAIALFVAVEAKAYQWAYGPNIQSGRGNNPPRGPSWMQQQNQNIFGPEVEWVCQSPKTNDMVMYKEILYLSVKLQKYIARNVT